MRYSRLLAAAAVLAIGTGIVWSQWWKSDSENVLLISGNIEAHESVLGFQVPGRVVDLPIEEGKWVEGGAIMARIDDRDFRQQVAHDGAQVKVYEAQLALALAGTRHQEIEVLRQSMLTAEAELAQRQIDYERADALFRQQATSKQLRDQAETNFKQAKSSYEAAKLRYDEAVEGTRKEEIRIASANLERAEEALKFARLQLDHTILRAPYAGVVLVRHAEPGEVVAAGTPVYTFADLDRVWLRAYVNETDLGRVRWDQPAAITTDTFPGKQYPGRITFISDKAEFTPKSVETHRERVTLVYRIKIDVANPNHELKPGMPADATITLVAKGPGE
jgi:HlyD family secretion protein